MFLQVVSVETKGFVCVNLDKILFVKPVPNQDESHQTTDLTFDDGTVLEITTKYHLFLEKLPRKF